MIAIHEQGVLRTRDRAVDVIDFGDIAREIVADGACGGFFRADAEVVVRIACRLADVFEIAEELAVDPDPEVVVTAAGGRAGLTDGDVAPVVGVDAGADGGQIRVADRERSLAEDFDLKPAGGTQANGEAVTGVIRIGREDGLRRAGRDRVRANPGIHGEVEDRGAARIGRADDDGSRAVQGGVPGGGIVRVAVGHTDDRRIGTAADVVGDRRPVDVIEGVLRDEVVLGVGRFRQLVILGDLIGRPRRVPDPNVVDLAGEGVQAQRIGGADAQFAGWRVGRGRRRSGVGRNRLFDAIDDDFDLAGVTDKRHMGPLIGRHGDRRIQFGIEAQNAGDGVGARPGPPQVDAVAVGGGVAVHHQHLIGVGVRAVPVEPGLDGEIVGLGERRRRGLDHVVDAVELRRAAGGRTAQQDRCVVDRLHVDRDGLHRPIVAVADRDIEGIGAAVIFVGRVLPVAGAVDPCRAVLRIAVHFELELRVAVVIGDLDPAGQRGIFRRLERVGQAEGRRDFERGRKERAVIAGDDFLDGGAVGAGQGISGDQICFRAVRQRRHVGLDVGLAARRVVDAQIEHLAIHDFRAVGVRADNQAACFTAGGGTQTGIIEGRADFLAVDVEPDRLCRVVAHGGDVIPDIRCQARRDFVANVRAGARFMQEEQVAARIHVQ